MDNLVMIDNLDFITWKDFWAKTIGQKGHFKVEWMGRQRQVALLAWSQIFYIDISSRHLLLPFLHVRIHGLYRAAAKNCQKQ